MQTAHAQQSPLEAVVHGHCPTRSLLPRHVAHHDRCPVSSTPRDTLVVLRDTNLPVTAQVQDKQATRCLSGAGGCARCCSKTGSIWLYSRAISAHIKLSDSACAYPHSPTGSTQGSVLQAQPQNTSDARRRESREGSCYMYNSVSANRVYRCGQAANHATRKRIWLSTMNLAEHRSDGCVNTKCIVRAVKRVLHVQNCPVCSLPASCEIASQTYCKQTQASSLVQCMLEPNQLCMEQ
jgi:hypothetical protein